MFDLLGFTYVLRLSTIIQNLLRFNYPVFPFLFRTVEIENWSGATKNRNVVSRTFQTFENGSPKILK